MTDKMIQIQKNEEKLEKLNNAIMKEKDAFIKATKGEHFPTDYISRLEGNNFPKWTEFDKWQSEFFTYYKEQGVDFYDYLKIWKRLENVYEKMKKVQKLEVTLANQKAKAEKENKKKDNLSDMPKVFDDLKNRMVKYNVDWTLNQKTMLQKELKELGREAFLKKYKYEEYDLAVYKKEDEIKKEIQTQVNKLVEDLFIKTKKICGNVKKFSDLRLTVNGSGYPILIGQVIGDNGTASIEPIEAGGYNIQKLHIRYIVRRWC